MRSIELLSKAGIECSIDKEITHLVRYGQDADEHSLFVDVYPDEPKYLDEALKKGALVLSERKKAGCIQIENARKIQSELLQILYDYPCHRMKLIGVTGTCGKSTVVYLLKQCLKDQGIKSCCVMSGKIIVDEEVIQTRNTTPDALSLIPLMDRCLKEGIGIMMMEVSSEAYLAHRVEGFYFDVMIGTVIASDHLDSHGTLKQYQETKKQILSLTKSDGVAIVNADDKCQRKWMSDLKGHVLSYGTSASFQISECECDLDKTSFQFQQIPLKTKLLSKANVYNLSAVIICAFVLDLNMKQVFTWAQRAQGCPGRFEIVHHDPLIMIDYAHTEKAVIEVLSFLKECSDKRLICVFGCGGDRDVTKRPMMAQAVCSYADEVIVTSDNPRTEDPEKIISEVIAGCTKEARAEIDRFKAIEFALETCTKDDIIILLGKGDELSFFTGGQMMPLSDKTVVKRILKEE
ncbi:MAG: UDP-N-acetylmuramoyl-L-alanyl-D-glutamate--2,6-diaminopimelate ligase [Erysipelotrichaceae bacterium]|nr:UDP-N-acetylmuramoyl-L-alanyl-D-glutamate--2,6-diaminopimelate ligase [Erysipelotrichaceae bacterium]